MSNSDELAYPVLETETGIKFHAGMTKREAFAMAAMQGLLAEGLMMDNEIASNSVNIADALLAELEK